MPSATYQYSRKTTLEFLYFSGFIMYSGMNSLKYNYFKMVFQSRLLFRSSSRSDVSCNYIGENP